MKSRTRLSRSRSIRDAVELISIEWNDGNENTEREREEGVHRFDSKTCAPEIVVLVRRCTDARALIRLLPAESHLPHTFSFVAGGGCLSLGGEREGEGRRGARAEADSRKKDSLSRKYERGLFVSSSSSSYENVSA